VSSPPVFYFDLSNPLAYIAAESLPRSFAGAAEWRPVLERELPDAAAWRPVLEREPPDAAAWRPVLERELPDAAAWRPALERELPECTRESPDVPALERLAREHGLQPLRWPSDHPFDSALAMQVATYANSIGRVVPFARAAFRQAFAGGRSLAILDNILIAAAACEMHPAAVLKGVELRSIRQQLASATAEAAQLGITCLPAVLDGGQLLTGMDAIGASTVP
jgi:2-hydroxychromene-2-carboxylate isomerase